MTDNQSPRDTHSEQPAADEPDTSTEESQTSEEPMNRAERRALKKGKGNNEIKGVNRDTARSGFNPKRINTAAHKEFTNRKSG